MKKEIANKRLNAGIIWQMIQTIAQKGIVFVIGVILARLLEPEDFGIFALLSFFIAIFEIFTDGGMGIALVQREYLTDEDRNFVFTINTLLSIISYLILFFCAPLISRFYATPEMTFMIRVLSLKIIIDALRVVPHAELRRSLDFEHIAKGRIIGVLTGGLFAILLLFFYVGIWCLILQQLVATSIMTTLFFIYKPRRPRLCFISPQIKQLLNFGIGIMFMTMLSKISKNIYTLIIGKSFSKDILGYYNRACSLEEIIVQTGLTTLGEPSGTVMYRLKSNREELREFVIRMLQLGGLFIFPLLVGLFCCSDQIIECILGKRWLPSSPMMKVLCCTGFFVMLSYYIACVYKACGKIRIMVGVEFFGQCMIILLAFLVYLTGNSIEIMLLSGCFAYFMRYLIDCYFCKRLIGYGFFLQISALWKIILCNLIMGVFVFVCAEFLRSRLNCFIQLPILVLSGAILYFICLKAFKVPLFEEYLTKIRTKLHL